MNRHRTLLILTVALLLVAALVPAFAQAPAAAPEAGKQQKQVTLIDMWLTGGWCMYPIGILSAIAIGLGIYSYLYSREDKMLAPAVQPQLREAMRKLDFRGAYAICAGAPATLTGILKYGLERLSRHHIETESVEKAMEEAATEENTVGLKPINQISVMASLAPMFGLLGTVDGMIKAFQKIGMGKMGDAEALAENIGEAMITTWFGLVVGIPAMLLYFWLKNRYAAQMARTARVLGEMTHEMQVSLDRVKDGEIPSASITLPDLSAAAAAVPAAPAPEA